MGKCRACENHGIWEHGEEGEKYCLAVDEPALITEEGADEERICALYYPKGRR